MIIDVIEIYKGFEYNYNLLLKQAERNLNKDIYSYEKQIKVFLEMAKIIVEMQKIYLIERNTNSVFNANEIIKIDYKTSEYAYDVYLKLERMLYLLHKLKKHDLISKYANELNMRISGNYENKQNKVIGMLQIAARFNVMAFTMVFELDKNEKVKSFEKRRPLLETCMFYVNRLIGTQIGIKYADKIMPNKIIFVVQQSGGKSLVANIYSSIMLTLAKEYFKTSGILRMGNTKQNANGFSIQIKTMIENERFTQIYPEFEKYLDSTNIMKCFSKKGIEEWKLKDLDPSIRASLFARGRKAAINSIRIFLALIIDDLSDGEKQANNDEEHKKQTNKYNTDMKGRAEFEDMPQLIFQTMFNPYDVPNQIISNLEQNDLLIDEPILPKECFKYFTSKYSNGKYKMITKKGGLKYVRATRDNKTIVIQIPALDENNESLAPEFRSTNYLIEQRDGGMSDYLWRLLFQSQRATREGRTFDWGKLKTYKELPNKNMSNRTIAVCDPTIKSGRDFFSISVYKINYANNKHYLIDCIFERKSIVDKLFRKKIIRFIINNKITEFLIETNTSREIKTIIEEDLKLLNYECEIIEVYNTVNKNVRILDQEYSIINDIIYPDKTIMSQQSELWKFMDNLTSWSSVIKVANDDAPDNVAMYSLKYINEIKEKPNTIKFKQLPYGI